MEIDTTRSPVAPQSLREAVEPFVQAFDPRTSAEALVIERKLVLMIGENGMRLTIADARAVALAARREDRIRVDRLPPPGLFVNGHQEAPATPDALRQVMQSLMTSQSRQISQLIGSVSAAMRLLGASPAVHAVVEELRELDAAGFAKTWRAAGAKALGQMAEAVLGDAPWPADVDAPPDLAPADRLGELLRGAALCILAIEALAVEPRDSPLWDAVEAGARSLHQWPGMATGADGEGSDVG